MVVDSLPTQGDSVRGRLVTLADTYTPYVLDRPADVLLAGALAMAVGALPMPASVGNYALKARAIGAFLASLWLLRVIDEAELGEQRGMVAGVRAFAMRS